MSATIDIFQIVKDIDLSQFKTWEDLYNFVEKNKYEKEYKDGKGNTYTYTAKKYEVIGITAYKVYSHRLRKQIREIQNKYKDYFATVRSYTRLDENLNEIYEDNRVYIDKYLIVKPILWRQGWFFKKSFFNNEWTIYYATNRKHMIRLLDKFIDVKPGIKDTRGLEAYRACLDAFKDNEDMVFELSW